MIDCKKQHGILEVSKANIQMMNFELILARHYSVLTELIS